MTLNKQKGNMYSFITHTWNPIKGKCPHQCSYCYYQNNPCFNPKIGKLRLDEKTLFDSLGKNNFIFVGSSTDMFAEEVPSEWIEKVLKWCIGYNKNKYLFQSKNPKRFLEFKDTFPKNTILGTTIETNRNQHIVYFSKAPLVQDRVEYLKNNIYKTMVTIEPIMDFDLEQLINLIKKVNPEWVNIGADSQNSNLPEPSPEKVKALIKELNKYTEVKVKDNLKRLL